MAYQECWLVRHLKKQLQTINSCIQAEDNALYKIKLTTAFILCAFLITACVSPFGAEVDSDNGQWVLKQVIYDDGDSKDFSSNSGNFVDIGQAEISEVYADHGKRTYPYTRDGDVFTLLVGDERITWTVVDRSSDRLKIDTPIGRYILSR